jgi:hypothetical protein
MSLAPYQALVALAEEERALALDGRWDELSDLLDRRGAVMAALPADDPAAARPLLERALAAHAQAHAAMGAARAGLLAELGGAGHTRAAVAGYRSATGAQGAANAADYRG